MLKRETLKTLLPALPTQADLKVLEELKGDLAPKTEGEAFLAELETRAKKAGRRKGSNILGLSDATGSMTPVWSATKKHIREMIKRAWEIGKFRMRWVAYRDYFEDETTIESSGWHDRPEALLDFVRGIWCYGGGKNEGEAVEKALEEAAYDPIATRVILIGDEPPLADCRELSKRLAELDRPVYSFVVRHGKAYRPKTIKAFEEISELSGGRSTMLNDVNDLLDVVVLTAAEDIGGADGVEQYLESYSGQMSKAALDYGDILMLSGG